MSLEVEDLMKLRIWYETVLGNTVYKHRAMLSLLLSKRNPKISLVRREITTYVQRITHRTLHRSSATAMGRHDVIGERISQPEI